MSWHRITINQDFRGRLVQNVLCFLNPDGLQTDLQLATIIETQWIPEFRFCQWTSHRYVQIIVQQIQTATPPAAFIKNISIVGTGSATAAAGFLAWKLKFQTGLAGRHFRGRYFIGGIANGFIDLSTEQVGTGTALTGMNTLAANLSAKFTGVSHTQPITLAIAHKNGDIPSLCSNITLDPVLCAIRSRKLGVGA